MGLNDKEASKKKGGEYQVAGEKMHTVRTPLKNLAREEKEMEQKVERKHVKGGVLWF